MTLYIKEIDQLHNISEDFKENKNETKLLNSNANLDEIIESKVERVLKCKIQEIEDRFESNNGNNFLNSLNLDLVNSVSFVNEIEKDENNYNYNYNIYHGSPSVQAHGKPATSSLFANEYCNYCSKPWSKIKYICLICTNYKVCSTCFQFHSCQHPLLLIDSNQSNPLFTNKSDLISFINKVYPPKKKTLIENINIFNPQLEAYKIQLTAFEKFTSFAIAKHSSYTYPLLLLNWGKTPVEDKIYIIFKNSKNLNIKCEAVNTIEVDEIKMSDCVFLTDSITDDYDIDVCLYNKQRMILYQRIQLHVSVVDEDKVEEQSANLCFTKYENLKALGKGEKVEWYQNIKNGRIVQEWKEIDELVEKYMYDVGKVIKYCLESRS